MLSGAMQAPVTDTPHSIWTIIDSASKLAFALIGGAWALLTYYRGRTFRRRLELTVNGSVILHSGVHLASLDVGVKNVGLSRADIIQEGTWLRIVILGAKTATNSVARPKRKFVGTSPILLDHSWIEPGEEIHDVMLVQLPTLADEDVSLEVRLRVVSNQMRFRSFFEATSNAIAEADDPASLMKQRLAWNAGAIIPLREKPAENAGTNPK